MDAFTKIINPGAVDTGHAFPSPLFCEIKWDGQRLSITGVEGPMANGDARGSCGQIVMSRPAIVRFNEGWDTDLWETFLDLWDRWHLNDMRAGTPAQEAHLRKLTAEFDNHGDPWNGPWRTFDNVKHPGGDHYGWAKHVLTEGGLQPDNGYSYGSAWLSEEVPHEVLVHLRELPDTEVTPAWV